MGTVVTAAAIDRLAWAMIDAAGQGLDGASLDVYRAGDDGGVIVRLSLLDGLGGGWDVSALGAVGETFVEGGFGGGWSRRGARRDARIREVAERALTAGPDERMWLHFRVLRRPYGE